MIVSKAYAYDLSVPEFIPDYGQNIKNFKVVKSPQNTKHELKTKINKSNTKSNSKSKYKYKYKLSLIVSVVVLFTMAICTSYRYNLISEKNLEIQRLRIINSAKISELATTEVAIDKIIDKDTVESYAKQQLGMKKPEKSQVIYINSNNETKVEQLSNENILDDIINKVKRIIGI